jgi:hypothetical protein
MSDFLFIIPEGWVQIPEEVISQIGSLVTDWVNMQNWTELSDALKVQGAIPQDMNVAEAKFFNGEVLVVKLG